MSCCSGPIECRRSRAITFLPHRRYPHFCRWHLRACDIVWVHRYVNCLGRSNSCAHRPPERKRAHGALSTGVSTNVRANHRAATRSSPRCLPSHSWPRHRTANRLNDRLRDRRMARSHFQSCTPTPRDHLVHIVALHPACNSIDEAATPTAIAQATQALGHSLDWERFRRVITAVGGFPFGDSGKKTAAWMDTGMFSRWAMDSLPSRSDAFDLLDAALGPATFDRLWATIRFCE